MFLLQVFSKRVPFGVLRMIRLARQRSRAGAIGPVMHRGSLRYTYDLDRGRIESANSPEIPELACPICERHIERALEGL